MKTSWKLVLVTAILVLTAWLSGDRPVQASVSCESLADKPCWHFGLRTSCTWANGSSGFCLCDGPTWDCA
jgi:hypothetical protein